MADTKISALTDGAPALGTDIGPFARAGANVRLTIANILTYALGQLNIWTDRNVFTNTFYSGSSSVNWQVGYDGSLGFNIGSTTLIQWKDGSNLAAGGTYDTKVGRGAAGVVALGGGTTSAFPGWKRNGAAMQFRLADDSANAFYQWAGQARVSTQFDKALNTTAADITGLSVPLTAGKTYRFKAKLHITAGASGGHKVAMACSSAPTSIIYQINSINNSTNAYIVNSRQTSSGGTAGQTGATTVYTEIEGTVTANAACNLTAQFAQNAVDASNSSVLVGSTLEVQEF